jgi:glycosyltransferase involved in cell wall biosynthesis
MGNWYLRQEMIECLAAFATSWPALRILLVTRDDREALRADLERAGVPGDRLILVSAPFEDMPRYIRLFDAGLFFIKPSFSKRGSAATKLAEFLGCGVPVVINDGVGDSGAVVLDRRIGVVLSSLDAAAYPAALAPVRAAMEDPAMRDRCRHAAVELFDLETGVERYRALYRRLL